MIPSNTEVNLIEEKARRSISRARSLQAKIAVSAEQALVLTAGVPKFKRDLFSGTSVLILLVLATIFVGEPKEGVSGFIGLILSCLNTPMQKIGLELKDGSIYPDNNVVSL